MMNQNSLRPFHQDKMIKVSIFNGKKRIYKIIFIKIMQIFKKLHLKIVIKKIYKCLIKWLINKINKKHNRINTFKNKMKALKKL